MLQPLPAGLRIMIIDGMTASLKVTEPTPGINPEAGSWLWNITAGRIRLETGYFQLFNSVSCCLHIFFPPLEIGLVFADFFGKIQQMLVNVTDGDAQFFHAFHNRQLDPGRALL